VCQSGPQSRWSNNPCSYSIQGHENDECGQRGENFQVENVANVPCKGKLRVARRQMESLRSGSASLERAWEINFKCSILVIQGPAPFTKIESNGFPKAARKSRLLLAIVKYGHLFSGREVVHACQSQIDHQSYPVIFGPALNFTLQLTLKA